MKVTPEQAKAWGIEPAELNPTQKAIEAGGLRLTGEPAPQGNLAAVAVAGKPIDATKANLGRDFEDALQDMHAQYEAEGRAVIRKLHTHVAVGSGQVRGSAPGVDYLGCLADGRAVAIEAKERSTARFQFSALTDAQRKFLMGWPGIGLIVAMDGEGCVWLAPSRVLEGNIKGGRKSWAWGDMVKLDGHDWLKVVEGWT